MQIKLLTDKEEGLWEKYAAQHPQSHFFHSSGWRRVIQRTFGHETLYFYAWDRDRMRGVLPLVRIKSLLWGHSLTSLPFAVYGGVIADNREIERALVQAATELGTQSEAHYLELRSLRPLDLGLAAKDLYVTFNLELADDPEINWKGMRKRNRNILRKGIKSGLAIHNEPQWGGIDTAELKIFYDLFARTQTALGTPVLPWNWFVNLIATYPEDIVLFSTSYKGKIINSLMVFRYKDTLLPYYIGYDPQYLMFAPNNFVLWEAIRFGCSQGFRHFDLGRSRKGTGSYEFKRHWGIEPQPLYYQYHLYPGQKMPDLNPSNPKFDLAKKTWSRLPLPVAKFISPWLIKYLG